MDRCTGGLFGEQFAHLFDEMGLATLGVAAARLDDLALSVDDEDVGYHVDAHGALEVAVGVEQHVIFPPVAVDEGFHLLDVLRLVDGYGHHLHARLVLPVGVHLVDGVELAVAGFAPRGEEADDERLATVFELGGVDGLSVDAFQRDGGELGVSHGYARKKQGGQQENSFHRCKVLSFNRETNWSA